MACWHAVGQQPKRQKLREVVPDPDKARLLMGQYLSGSIPSPPWEAMGLSRPPVIAGKFDFLFVYSPSSTLCPRENSRVDHVCSAAIGPDTGHVQGQTLSLLQCVLWYNNELVHQSVCTCCCV